MLLGNNLYVIDEKLSKLIRYLFFSGFVTKSEIDNHSWSPKDVPRCGILAGSIVTKKKPMI